MLCFEIGYWKVKPEAGEEEILHDLLSNRVPPGVDEAAYVKASFLSAVANGDTVSPVISPERAVELLGTMQGTLRYVFNR